MHRRLLGFWETGSHFLHDRGEGTGTLCLMARISGKIDHALLREALYLLYERHPLLRATIHSTQDAVFFNLSADFNAIQLHFITLKGEDHWIEYAEEELGRPFSSHEYLWRVTLLTKGEYNELLISFHHAIADGISCIRFVDEFLRIYTELQMCSFIKITPLPFLDCIENLVSFKSNPQELQSEIAKINSGGLTTLSYQTFKPLKERSTKTHLLELDKNQLISLRQKCHAQHVTVNSLLYAALLLAEQQLLGQTLSVRVATPIQLRTYCTPPIDEEHFGCFLSYIEDVLWNINSQTTIWDLSRTYEQQLVHLIPKTAFLPAQFAPKLSPYFSLPTKEEFYAAACVTDKGFFRFPEVYGSLKLEALYITSSCRAGGIMMSLSATSVLDKMFLAFSYPHPLISASFAEELINRFKKIIFIA